MCRSALAMRGEFRYFLPERIYRFPHLVAVAAVVEVRGYRFALVVGQVIRGFVAA